MEFSGERPAPVARFLWPIKMTRRPAFRNSVLPFGFQPAEFIEAHKNGVKRSGGNAAVARDVKSYLRCLGNGQTAATIPAVRIRLTTAGEKASNTVVEALW